MNNKFFLGSGISSFKNLGKTQPVSKVVVVVDEDTSYVAGYDTGYTFTVTNPYGTQQMANNLLQVAKGYTYQGFKADQLTLPVTAELGDALTMRGVYGMLSNRSISFSPLFTANVETPWEQEVQHNYPYEGSYKKEIKQKVALGKDYYGTRITRQHGLEVVRTDSQGNESAFVRLNSDVLAFYDATGQEALYFDAVAGKYRFRGDVEITGGYINVNDQFIVEEDGKLTLANVLEFDPNRGQYIFSGDVQITNGNLDVSGDVDISGNVMLGGSLKLTGNIDLSGASSISWGSNDPSDGSGISVSEAQTIIKQQLVSSPNIAGGKFWDIAQEAYITLDADFGAGHRYADLRFFQGSSEIFRIAADNTLSDFDLSSGGRVTVALNTIAGMLLYAESTYNGEFWTDTIWPQGTWNFEDANVEGLTQTYVPVWG